MYFVFRRHEHISTEGYVGNKVCRECHKEQYESWAKTRMARTFEVLRPGKKSREKQLVGLDPNKDYTTDAKCLGCHTTGYGRVGGFVSREKTPEMAGVGCESCHGPGGMYVRTVMSLENPNFPTSEAVAAGLIYPPSAKVFARCHNSRSSFVGKGYKFDFEERVARGTHEHRKLRYDHLRQGK